MEDLTRFKFCANMSYTLYFIFAVFCFVALATFVGKQSPASIFFTDNQESTRLHYMQIYFTQAVVIINTALSFFGYVATSRNNMNLVNMHLVMTVPVLIFHIVAIILFCSYGIISHTELRHNMETTMSNYFTSKYDQNGWDSVQREYKCCGIDSPLDWNRLRISAPGSSSYWNGSSWAPQSCYFLGCYHLFRQGCQSVVYGTLLETFFVIMGILIYSFFINLGVIWVVQGVRRRLKNDQALSLGRDGQQGFPTFGTGAYPFSPTI